MYTYWKLPSKVVKRWLLYNDLSVRINQSGIFFHSQCNKIMKIILDYCKLKENLKVPLFLIIFTNNLVKIVTTVPSSPVFVSMLFILFLDSVIHYLLVRSISSFFSHLHLSPSPLNLTIFIKFLAKLNTGNDGGRSHGRDAGYTVDRLPVHHRATQRQTTTHTHTHS